MDFIGRIITLSLAIFSVGHSNSVQPGFICRSTSVTYLSRRISSARPVLSMGWADKNWNWGSPFGTAHDLAMALRDKLDSEPERVIWIEGLLAGDVDLEEAKLALGLRIQHAAREGIDGNGAGRRLMLNMKDCKYEGREDLLTTDLEELIAYLPTDPEREAPDDTSAKSAAVAAARALIAMRFYKDGL